MPLAIHYLIIGLEQLQVGMALFRVGVIATLKIPYGFRRYTAWRLERRRPRGGGNRASTLVRKSWTRKQKCTSAHGRVELHFAPTIVPCEIELHD